MQGLELARVAWLQRLWRRHQRPQTVKGREQLRRYRVGHGYGRSDGLLLYSGLLFGRTLVGSTVVDGCASNRAARGAGARLAVKRGREREEREERGEREEEREERVEERAGRQDTASRARARASEEE